MKHENLDNPGESPPRTDLGPDSHATMKAASTGPGSDPRRLRIEDLRDPATAQEALASWDELSPAVLSAIEAHPHLGPRLAMLRAADRHLEQGLGRGQNAGQGAGPDACPSSEELYDYGRGPGYGPLPSAQRAQIERHLLGCEACEAIVETLEVPPPVPLDVPGAYRARVPAPTRSVTPRPSPILPEPVNRPPLRRLPRLAPLAMAASLVAALGLWIVFSPSRNDRPGFPEAPLLRGTTGSALNFPRDRVLRAGPDSLAAFPVLRGAIAFEIDPVAEASTYEVDLRRHGSDAFAADEEILTRLSSPEPMLRAQLALPTGQYTWSARAIVRGLGQELGSRDFEVVEDASLERKLAELADVTEPRRSLDAVRLLHEFGDLSSARAIARTMPESPERDAYLLRTPGR
jgi:hypothetical protein